MAENFVLFDRWFCSVPGPTNPNRAYITSGTSNGHGKNDLAFLEFALPQKSIFQLLTEKHITWTNYQVSLKQWKSLNMMLMELPEQHHRPDRKGPHVSIN